jgi:hypothetical protein
VADALVFAPKRIEAVPAAAHAGASWRAGLRIPEPSPSLNQAISSMARAVRTAVATGSGPPLDALLHAIGDSQPDEPALDRLVRAALRSALEQRQARQADEGGMPARSNHFVNSPAVADQRRQGRERPITPSLAPSPAKSLQSTSVPGLPATAPPAASPPTTATCCAASP